MKLDEFQRIAKFYSAQPRRTECKICEFPLTTSSFRKMGIDYYICARCGHLNGGHIDTEEFCSFLYSRDEGKSYGTNYKTKDKLEYKKRLEDIYLPKADFLFDALSDLQENPLHLRYVDIGAGSGYFVGALAAKGIETIHGYEVSASQVQFGNTMLGKKLLRQHSLAEITEIGMALKADVVSLIGVLEHLLDPRSLLQSLTRKESIRYLFISVPLFSPCVFFEMIFPEVMPRQLVGGHTHLYTESSINWFCNEFGLKRVAEWWFGTDMVDLYRSMLLSLRKNLDSVPAAPLWGQMFNPLIDDMQLAMDKHRSSSEVHMLLKVQQA